MDETLRLLAAFQYHAEVRGEGKDVFTDAVCANGLLSNLVLAATS